MSWARYDDQLPANWKVAALRAEGVNGIAALGLHLLANTWSRNQGTHGHIPTYMPEQLAGRAGPKLAVILTEVTMFDEVEDGWMIHDFEDFSPPGDDGRPADDKRRELSMKRAKAGSKGGLAKAANANQTSSKRSSKSLANAKQTSTPDPDPDPDPDFALQTQDLSPLYAASNGEIETTVTTLASRLRA